MEEFCETLDKGTELFKGVKFENLSNKVRDGACWFALDKDIAQGYANSYAEEGRPGELYKLKTKKELKLLNILSLKFKLDFWEKCNKFYSENITADMKKLEALIPLGIPNLEGQMAYVRGLSCDTKIKLWGDLIGGHRCSFPQLDNAMVAAMINIYQDEYDGYIQPSNVMTCFHDGNRFPREICMFKCQGKISNKVSLLGTFDKVKGEISGGYIKIDKNLLRREEISFEDWRKAERDFVEAIGYKGEIKHDELGRMIPLGLQNMLKDKKEREKERTKLQNSHGKPAAIITLSSDLTKTVSVRKS